MQKSAKQKKQGGSGWIFVLAMAGAVMGLWVLDALSRPAINPKVSLLVQVCSEGAEAAAGRLRQSVSAPHIRTWLEVGERAQCVARVSGKPITLVVRSGCKSFDPSRTCGWLDDYQVSN